MEPCGVECPSSDVFSLFVIEIWMYFLLLNECGFGLASGGLKTDRLMKDGIVKGGKNEVMKEAVRRTPLKSYIILGKDFVYIIAKVSAGFMTSRIQGSYILGFRT
jgi:hypothetical protein